MHLGGGGCYHGHGLATCGQIQEKLLRIVQIVPGLMVAGGDAGAAGDAVFRVYLDFEPAVIAPVYLVGAVHGTGIYALVAAGAFFFDGIDEGLFWVMGIRHGSNAPPFSKIIKHYILAVKGIFLQDCK
jgi:hypothetical protein